MIPLGILLAILITGIAILTALKTGFNEVIRGLEAISEALDKAAKKTP